MADRQEGRFDPFKDSIRADQVKARHVEYLYEDRIPLGMLSVVAGMPDQGKGLFTAHIAAEISRRGENVLYSAVEDDHGWMTRPRLEAAKADLSKIVLRSFTLPSMIDELWQIVTDADIRLIVFDPFNVHLDRGISRYNDSVREATTPLDALAREANCAVVITEHAVKSIPVNAHPLACIGGGSSGLRAAVRAGFILGVDPQDEDRRIVCHVKSNTSRKQEALAFEVDTADIDTDKGTDEYPLLLPEGGIGFYDPIALVKPANAPSGPKADKRAGAAEWLANYLNAKGGPALASEIHEDANQYRISRNTLRRAANDLDVVKNPPSGGRNCTWDLPQDLRDAMEAMGGGDDE